eukprot:scaffold2557_cov121-Cylindrotheca_fusiformis.AAC.15
MSEPNSSIVAALWRLLPKISVELTKEPLLAQADLLDLFTLVPSRKKDAKRRRWNIDLIYAFML